MPSTEQLVLIPGLISEPKSPTLALVEWLSNGKPDDPAGVFRAGIAQVDDILVRGPRYQSMSQWSGAWLHDVHAVLSLRYQTAQRKEFVEGESAVIEPEPTPEDLADHLIQGTRFSAFETLSRGFQYQGDDLRSRQKWTAEQLEKIRVNVAGPASLVVPSWAAIEARFRQVTSLQAALQAKQADVGGVLADLGGDSLVEPATFAVEMFGQDVLAEAIDRALDEPIDLPTENEEMLHIRQKLEEAGSSSGVSHMRGSFEVTMAAHYRRELEQAYEDAKNRLEAHRQNLIQQSRQSRLTTIHAAIHSLDGWGKLGRLAEKHAGLFPTGFVEAWLQAGRDAIGALGESQLFEALQVVPKAECEDPKADLDYKHSVAESFLT